MTVCQNLDATAALVQHWAKPEINHCPTPAEAADVAAQLRLAAIAIRELLAEAMERAGGTGVAPVVALVPRETV